jgi:hypothetical protein
LVYPICYDKNRFRQYLQSTMQISPTTSWPSVKYGQHAVIRKECLSCLHSI